MNDLNKQEQKINFTKFFLMVKKHLGIKMFYTNDKHCFFVLEKFLCPVKAFYDENPISLLCDFYNETFNTYFEKKCFVQKTSIISTSIKFDLPHFHYKTENAIILQIMTEVFDFGN